MQSTSMDGHLSLCVNMSDEAALAEFVAMDIQMKPIKGVVQPPVHPVGKPHRITDALKYVLKTVLKAIYKHHYAWPFREPVNAVKLKIPDYHSIVKYPMDLNTIKKRIENGFYCNVNECIKDFQVLFYNCYRYNKPNQDIYIMGQAIEKVFDTQMRTCPKEHVFKKKSLILIEEIQFEIHEAEKEIKLASQILHMRKKASRLKKKQLKLEKAKTVEQLKQAASIKRRKNHETPGPVSVSIASVTPVCQAPMPIEAPSVPSGPSPNLPSTSAELTPAAKLQGITPQILTPLMDPASPFLSKPRECNSKTDHPASNSYGANKVPELTAQPGVPNYTVSNQAPPVASSVTNGEKKMKQKSSPVFSTPTTKKQAESKLKNCGSTLKQSAANSPSTSNTATNLKSTAMDSFQQFKKQAKEKADKQRQLNEQQELRRHQIKQTEKERIKMEREKQRKHKKEEVLERMRKPQQQQQKEVLSVKQEKFAPMTPVTAVKPESSAPVLSPVLSEREELRQREQEKRQREVQAESKLKNCGSTLKQSAANSPSTSNTATNLKSTAMDSFQQFKKQAREKAEKQRRLYEQQELRKHQIKQNEKERIKMEREKQRKHEKLEVLERVRTPQQQQQKDTLSARQEKFAPITPVAAVTPEFPAPVSSPALSKKEELKRREQEKRHREARANHIDMNLQNDILATFEESLDISASCKWYSY